MKRFLSLLIIAACLFTLFGCAKAEPAKQTAVQEDHAGTFRIGYGRTDITPLTAVPLAGYGNSTQRISQTILDLQYATCIAVTDEHENTVLLISYDQQRASDITVEAVRPAISQATGVPVDHIMMAGTHTHSGPDLNASSNEAIARYIPYLNEQLVNAAVAAMADRTPVRSMEAGSIETEAMNFVRHYAYIDENGEEKYFGDSFGTSTINDTTRHITEADPTKLVVPYPGIPELLRTIRADGVKTAILSNKPDNMTCFIAAALFPGLFDIVHGQRAAFPKKPDPTAVLLLCEELGVTPAECLYVGDSGVDMQTGKNAGIVTAGVTWGFRGAEELQANGADFLAHTAEDLLSLIM